MRSFQDWFRRNTLLIRMVSLFVLLYVCPVALFTVFYPDLSAPAVSTIACGLTILFVLYVFCGTTRGWNTVRDTITQASLDRNSKETDDPLLLEREKIVDYTSSNVLVVKNTPDDVIEAVSFLKRSTEISAPEVIIPEQPIEKKKAMRKSKSVKGGT